MCSYLIEHSQQQLIRHNNGAASPKAGGGHSAVPNLQSHRAEWRVADALETACSNCVFLCSVGQLATELSADGGNVSNCGGALQFDDVAVGSRLQLHGQWQHARVT